MDVVEDRLVIIFSREEDNSPSDFFKHNKARERREKAR